MSTITLRQVLSRREWQALVHNTMSRLGHIPAWDETSRHIDIVRCADCGQTAYAGRVRAWGKALETKCPTA